MKAISIKEDVVTICSINGAGHHWRLESYEKYISRGTCDCGAVKFFSNDFSMESIVRAELLNKKHEKGGKAMPVFKSNQLLEKQEADSTKEHQVASQSTMPPVPPKPEGKGNAVAYWQENKAEILADLARIGYNATMRRWKVSPSVLTKLRGHTGMRSRAKTEPKATKPVTKPPIPETEPPIPDKSNELSETSEKAESVKEESETPTLPELPAFDSAWPTLTQVEWLRTYRDLASR